MTAYTAAQVARLVDQYTDMLNADRAPSNYDLEDMGCDMMLFYGRWRALDMHTRHALNYLYYTWEQNAFAPGRPPHLRDVARDVTNCRLAAAQQQ